MHNIVQIISIFRMHLLPFLQIHTYIFFIWSAIFAANTHKYYYQLCMNNSRRRCGTRRDRAWVAPDSGGVNSIPNTQIPINCLVFLIFRGSEGPKPINWVSELIRHLYLILRDDGRQRGRMLLTMESAGRSLILICILMILNQKK